MKINIEAQILETTYKGIAAISLETKRMKVVVVPEIGAKIVSLFYKPTQKEWLLDSGQRPLLALEEGAAFGESDMSGWDECFPTINACNYPLPGEFKGRALPDHGEIWSLPWEAIKEQDSLKLKVEGQCLPYIFQRKMSFIAENVMRLEYEVTNLSDEDLAVMWTAHPQFTVTPDTRICLPEAIKQMICVHGGNGLLANEAVYNWPIAYVAGQDIHLDTMDFSIEKDSKKFYYADEVPEGWSGLSCRESEDYLLMKVAKEQVPYLGIWVDEKDYNDRVTCALEPSTGFYDSLTRAAMNQKCSIIGSRGTLNWQLDVSLGIGRLTEAI
jgi:galactose mutarotase-like enzyme